LQQFATVCEQSATVFTCENESATVCEQNATDCNFGRSEDRRQTAKNQVVEHKGLSDELVEFFSYLIGVKSL
jgi:hypothetical protein